MRTPHRRAHPAGARYAKRQLTGPITLTITQAVPPPRPTSTSIIIVTPSPSIPPTSSVTSITSISSSISSSSTTSSISRLSPPSSSSTPSPIVSVISTATSDVPSDLPAPITGALSTSRLPAGAIVGIAIGGVLILLAIVVVLVRSRFKRSRDTRRATWLKGGGISNPMPEKGQPGRFTAFTTSSFAPAPLTAANMAAYPASIETSQQPPSPEGPFARAQSAALSVMPAPVQATYNTPPVPALPRQQVSPRTVLDRSMATVKFTFIPNLTDELSITPGEVVRVVEAFDDGWAMCQNGRNQQGMVPLECLDRVTGTLGAGNPSGLGRGTARNSRRESSLNALGRR